jgi:ABC-type nickel/cobalt efflux system permease component RcnA
MKKIILSILLIGLLVLTIGCDVELGAHEDHDHDGDGIQDHTAEEHDEEMHEDEHHDEEKHEDEVLNNPN